jgi:hypothetical protein
MAASSKFLYAFPPTLFLPSCFSSSLTRHVPSYFVSIFLIYTCLCLKFNYVLNQKPKFCLLLPPSHWLQLKQLLQVYKRLERRHHWLSLEVCKCVLPGIVSYTSPRPNRQQFHECVQRSLIGTCKFTGYQIVYTYRCLIDEFPLACCRIRCC